MSYNRNYQTFMKPVSRVQSGHEQDGETRGRDIQLNTRQPAPISETFKSSELHLASADTLVMSDKKAMRYDILNDIVSTIRRVRGGRVRVVERDRFEKQLGAGWLSAYQYAREGHASSEEISDKLVSTLSKTLRENGGIPAFDEMARILTEGRGCELLAAFGALDGLAEGEDGHRHTKIAAEVAKSLIVQWEASGWNVEGSEIPARFAEALCSALVEHYYFAKARQPLLAEGRFDSLEHGARWQSQIEEMLVPQLSEIAAKLVQKPDASGLRAPKRMTRKERTGDLLAENLLGVAPSNRSPASPRR